MRIKQNFAICSEHRLAGSTTMSSATAKPESFRVCARQHSDAISVASSAASTEAADSTAGYSDASTLVIAPAVNMNFSKASKAWQCMRKVRKTTSDPEVYMNAEEEEEDEEEELATAGSQKRARTIRASASAPPSIFVSLWRCSNCASIMSTAAAASIMSTDKEAPTCSNCGDNHNVEQWDW